MSESDESSEKNIQSDLEIQITKLRENTAILIAVFSLISAVAGFFFNYLTSRTQIELPIAATETAAVRQAFTASIESPNVTPVSTAVFLPQTQDSTPADVRAKQSQLILEHLQSHVWAYQLPDEHGLDAFFSHLSITNNGDSDIDYKIEYALPAESNDSKSAGLVFNFVKDQDFSAYKFLEIAITFGDKSTRCSFGITDITGKTAFVNIERNPENDNVTYYINGDTYQVTIPLSTYANKVNLKVIRSVSFDDGNRFSNGKHTYTVKSMKLLLDMP